MLSAFGEEHHGDMNFYEQIITNNNVFRYLCRRKLFNPFKWIQLLAGLFFTTLSFILYACVDTLVSPLALLIGGGIYLLKRNAFHVQDDEDPNEVLKHTIHAVHTFIGSLPKYLIMGNIGFVRNPIEIILSPVNRVWHPMRRQHFFNTFLTVIAVGGLGGLAALSYMYLGFALFSHISVLLFFPVLINMIIGYAGPLMLEIISGVITSFNMMGVILNFFESSDEQHQLEQQRLRQVMNGAEFNIENSFAQVLESIKDLNRNHLPAIYHEKFGGKMYHQDENSGYKLTDNEIQHYDLYKFFDLDFKVERAPNTPDAHRDATPHIIQL